jgi:hypothetical protein
MQYTKEQLEEIRAIELTEAELVAAQKSVKRSEPKVVKEGPRRGMQFTIGNISLEPQRKSGTKPTLCELERAIREVHENVMRLTREYGPDQVISILHDDDISMIGDESEEAFNRRLAEARKQDGSKLASAVFQAQEKKLLPKFKAMAAAQDAVRKALSLVEKLERDFGISLAQT